MPDLELVCLHEAGHAVAHYSFGHPIQYVSVSGERGGVRLEPLVDPTAWANATLERAEQEIVANLAGPMATGILLRRNVPEAEASDFRSIGWICSRRGLNESDMTARLRPQTAELIRGWESAIRSLARSLQDAPSGRLSGREVVKAIEASSGKNPIPLDWKSGVAASK